MTDLTYTLDQIDAACENATDGPWQEIGTDWSEAGDMLSGYVIALSGPHDHGEDVTGDGVPVADAEFIALARTALPELAAKVRELEAELAREERWGDKQQRRANHYQGLFRDRENEPAWQDRAEKAEAALARVKALADAADRIAWQSVSTDYNGNRFGGHVSATAIHEALKETP